MTRAPDVVLIHLDDCPHGAPSVSQLVNALTGDQP
jgi:hypothetical protein